MSIYPAYRYDRAITIINYVHRLSVFERCKGLSLSEVQKTIACCGLAIRSDTSSPPTPNMLAAV